MPTIFGHAVAGLTIAAAFKGDRLPRRTWIVATACAVAPDADWFVSLLPLARGHALNHRGAAHSLFAALVLATLALVVAYRPLQRRFRLWLCLAAAAVSHGLLDACTCGGVGVALFMPFSDTRWACVFQPVHVSPLPLNPSAVELFVAQLWTEAVWIGLPALLIVGWTRLVRRATSVPVLSLAAPEA
jgi:inner membrane protein